MPFSPQIPWLFKKRLSRPYIYNTPKIQERAYNPSQLSIMRGGVIFCVAERLDFSLLSTFHWAWWPWRTGRGRVEGKGEQPGSGQVQLTTSQISSPPWPWPLRDLWLPLSSGRQPGEVLPDCPLHLCLSQSFLCSNWTQIWFNIFGYLWNPFTPTSAVLLNFLLSKILLISILLGVRGRGFLYAGTQFDGKKKSFYQTSQVNLGTTYNSISKE